MRVISCMLLLALLCLTSAGCSLFKKNNNGNGSAAPGGGTPPAKVPATAPDPLLNSTVPPAPTFQPLPVNKASAEGQSAIFARPLLDAHHNKMPNAYIRLVSLDAKDSGAP